MRFLVLIFIVFLTGCSSVRYVPVGSVRVERDTIVRHDTINRYIRSDSKVKEVVKDCTNVVQDEAGNIKSKERIRDRYLIIENRDSIDYYRHMADSVMSIKKDSVQVPYPVERELSRWEQAELAVGGFVIRLLSFVFVCTVVVWLIKKKRAR